MKTWRRTSLRRILVPVLLVTFGWLFVPGPGLHAATELRSQCETAGVEASAYSWGYQNELTGITYPNSSTNSFTTNRLFSRVQKTDSGGASTSLYDGSGVVADSRADYTWGGATGLISERAGTTSRWYHGDSTGGTRGLTDSTQAATDSLDFDAFGLPVRTSGSIVTPFRHKGGQGYRTDADSGLMLLGQRYYDASLGRFISRDPLAYAAGDVNLYRYCNNNPVNASDPSGQHPVAAALLLMGAAAIVTEFLVVLTTVIIAGLVILLIGLLLWKLIGPMFTPRPSPPPPTLVMPRPVPSGPPGSVEKPPPPPLPWPGTGPEEVPGRPNIEPLPPHPYFPYPDPPPSWPYEEPGTEPPPLPLPEQPMPERPPGFPEERVGR